MNFGGRVRGHSYGEKMAHALRVGLLKPRIETVEPGRRGYVCLRDTGTRGCHCVACMARRGERHKRGCSTDVFQARRVERELGNLRITRGGE